MNRAAESGLEVKLPMDPEVAAQPDGNKYFVKADSGRFNSIPQNQSTQSDSYYKGVGVPNYPVFTQSNQSNPGAKNISWHKAFWALAVFTVVCLAIALGVGLGVGLAAQHKSSSTGDAPTTSTSNLPTTITQASTITTTTPTPTALSSTTTPTPTALSSTKTPTPTALSSTTTPTPTALSSLSCPAANGSTYTATNKPPITYGLQIPQNSFSFEILCNTNTGQVGDVRDMQIITNVTSLTDCIDACALFDFQTKTSNFPAFACTGVSWGHGDPVHVCWLKSNVTLGSPNNTVTWPGYHGAVLLDT